MNMGVIQSTCAKLSRKTITLALHARKTHIARETFSSMNDKGRDSPHTQYLMYKVAMYEEDETLGKSSLEKWASLCLTLAIHD